MSTAEVMTTAIIAARYFGGNQQTACATLRTLGYRSQICWDFHASTERLRQVSEHFRTMCHVLDCRVQSSELVEYRTVLIPSLSDRRAANVCISRSRLYQGPDWLGRIASKRRPFYGLISPSDGHRDSVKSWKRFSPSVSQIGCAGLTVL